MSSLQNVNGLQRVGEVSLYAADALVRRATQLQKTKDANQNFVAVNSVLAKKLNLQAGDKVKFTQASTSDYGNLKIDNALADDCVWVPAAQTVGINMSETFAPIELEKA